MLCYVSLEVGGNNDVYIIMRGLDSRTDRTGQDRTGQAGVDRLASVQWYHGTHRVTAQHAVSVNKVAANIQQSSQTPLHSLLSVKISWSRTD